MADKIIAKIPRLPRLAEKTSYVAGRTPWETPPDSALHTCFIQH
jgi:hypothetical protein